ncbi:hypothetical protein DSM112329_00126 [Paraconexibacter sp. AEG42_29]|uniref:DUF3105 domain-containing protein n=1 Tax=Paraconexibacter sp. AEG42_29 TaxID=2997339 RepID=A0AAU7ANX5_9ACTN
MSSRQEEKAARKAEREAQEAQAAKAAATSKRIQLVFGVVLVIAILGGAGALIASSGGGGESTGTVEEGGIDAKVAIPPVKITELAPAAKAAGCVLSSPEIEGSNHVTGEVTYKTNPPTSGDHNEIPATDGIYAAGNEPAKENYVHSLEHGRIEIQYPPGTPVKTVNQLETLGSEELNGSDAYHVLVFQNNTGMKPKVAAAAWGQLLACPAMNDQVFDAIRAFRKDYTDKGPELVP